MSTITWIGLGHMGAPMSANLVAAGHDVRGFDLSEAAMAAAPEAARDAYTRVLQGLIGLSRLRFPRGLAGRDRDVVASGRRPAAAVHAACGLQSVGTDQHGDVDQLPAGVVASDRQRPVGGGH